MSAEATLAALQSPAAVRLRICGRVQGVGLRPFVARLAQQVGIAGSVQNQLGVVEIVAEGTQLQIESFTAALIGRAPPFATLRLDSCESVAPSHRRGFVVLDSASGGTANIFVPPDVFTCADCLRELTDPQDRRHGYPFINCTQCGPRYTLIHALPYDRANTTMAEFPLCELCAAEYGQASDRRFHAEPVACAACGPQLSFARGQCEPVRTTDAALLLATQVLEAGEVLAVKGVGGYHLMCDATQSAAVARLRERKRRPAKPLAVLFPQRGVDGLEAVHDHVELDRVARRALLSAARPIVLVHRRSDSSLAAQIAPGLDEVGAFLPYSPLHHLLSTRFGGPLVATSGNISGEPVLCDNDEATERLNEVADAFLHHNRRIARPADDSVMRVIRRRARTLRVGRGLAPCEMTLPMQVSRPLLAVGGHLKTTIALSWGRRAVMSPHIGDMGSVRSERVFNHVVTDLQRLHGIHAEAVVCDAHPGYATTRWARECGLPVHRVQHHRAHASALAGEHDSRQTALVFAWDGVGLGDDGTLWGGETFLGKSGDWQRVASLRPFRLTGGERAGRSPWRSAAALCWEAGIDWAGSPAPPLAHEAWQRNVNTAWSSAVGRLFDAAAAIILDVHEATFEGQGPMMLETCARVGATVPAGLPLAEDPTQLLRIDWAPLVAGLCQRKGAKCDLAWHVHATLARTIADIALRMRAQHEFAAVGLTGGVFQNRKLTELAADLLEHAGFHVWLHERIPCNDGGLAVGQIIEASARTALEGARA